MFSYYDSRNGMYDIFDNIDSMGLVKTTYNAVGNLVVEALNDVAGDSTSYRKKLREENTFPPELWPMLGQYQFLGTRIPKEYGGAGASFLEHLAVIAAVSYHCGAAALSMLAHTDLGIGRIYEHGTEEQKMKYLPGAVNGSKVLCLAISEPNAGTAAIKEMKTRAVFDKETGLWTLNGTKCWITNGSNKFGETADVCIVYAKTTDDNGKEGVTAFIVEKGMEGFIAGKKADKGGMRGSDTSELMFKDVKLSNAQRLGPVNGGTEILTEGLKPERYALTAAAIGLAQRAMNEAKYYMSVRTQGGKHIGGYQKMAFDAAKMESELLSLEHYTFYSAHAVGNDISKIKPLYASSVFREAGRVCVDNCLQSLEMLGGNGYTLDYPMVDLLLDSILYRIGGGTMNARDDNIAKDILEVYAAYDKAERSYLSKNPLIIPG